MEPWTNLYSQAKQGTSGLENVFLDIIEESEEDEVTGIHLIP